VVIDRLKEIAYAFKYGVQWGRKDPKNAFRAGAEHSLLAALIALVTGKSVLAVQWLIGIGRATVNYYRS
jgi:hypothetical protein